MYSARPTPRKTKTKHKKNLFFGTSVIVAVLAVSAGLSYALQASNETAANRASHALAIKHASASFSLGTSAPATKPVTSDTPVVASATSSLSSTATPATVAAAAAQTPLPAASAVASAPLKGLSLFSYANGDVETAARAYGASHPAAAAAMNKLASQSIAQWFGEWNNDVGSAVNTYVSAAAGVGQVPVLVSYYIPNRDCGSYSAGGATSAANYTSWMQAFAAGIGQRPAIVILEPDAVAGLDCLSSADQQTRLQLISNAVALLKTTTGAKVYIDAGNPTWKSVSTMQQRLTSAGMAVADGFSLNVSNFITTADNISYGNKLSAALGGKHYVIDTSRNGNGPTSDNQWCNPDGRAIGQLPTLSTGYNLVDAFLWIKSPGASDGGCGPNQAGTSAPSAGTWWPEYALTLL